LQFKIKSILSLTIITLIYSSLACSAANISIIPGIGSYVVQGTGMDGVAGIQLDISYDASSLATPTVTQGNLVAGAMLAANTSKPGSIKIAIISTTPFAGSGQIATISFASKTGNGGITSITSSMIDSKGAALSSTGNNVASTETASNGIITNPGVPFSQPTAQPSQTSPLNQTIQSQTTTTTTATTPTYLGTVTLPTDQQQRADSQPPQTATAPVYASEPPAARTAESSKPSEKTASNAKAEESPQYVHYKSIADRFKAYAGKKQLSQMAQLFEKKVAQHIQQNPAIVISNGKSKALLTVDIPARINSSPNFAVNGGTLISFKQDNKDKGRWIVEVVPETGSLTVPVTVIAGSEEFEYPLTLAPPVKTTLTLDEKGWNRFLKEVGTAKAPLHDLNNDGVRDYLDEYIFVANYLANKGVSAKPAEVKTPKKK
jgi:hypothetical protein